MKIYALAFFVLFTVSCGNPHDSQSISGTSSAWQDDYPQTPDSDYTPGELCPEADYLRYPEQIRYCKRNVSRDTKQEVIAMYDDDLGYSVGSMPRSLFKVDHYIPLCAGGANTEKNLWPQHKSVYKITDPLEPKVCELMSLGGITQAEVVDLVNLAKHDLERAPQVIRDLDSKLNSIR